MERENPRRLEVGVIENYISQGYQFQKAFQLLKYNMYSETMERGFQCMNSFLDKLSMFFIKKQISMRIIVIARIRTHGHGTSI